MKTLFQCPAPNSSLENREKHSKYLRSVASNTMECRQTHAHKFSSPDQSCLDENKDLWNKESVFNTSSYEWFLFSSGHLVCWCLISWWPHTWSLSIAVRCLTTDRMKDGKPGKSWKWYDFTGCKALGSLVGAEWGPNFETGSNCSPSFTSTEGNSEKLANMIGCKKCSLFFAGFDPKIEDFFVAWNVKCWEACLKSVTKCKLTRQHHHASANLLRFLEPYRQQSNKKYLLISYNLWSSWWFTKCLWSASACQCKPPQIV